MSVINIKVNAKLMQFEGNSLADVITQYGATPPFAVAVNGDFVPQTVYHAQRINEGDEIDIVAPIFGG